MKSILTAFAAAICLFVALPVAAASYSTDSSDLWETNPAGSENGWGIQLVQRGSTIFGTMFVYGPAETPTWFVATMNPAPPGSNNWTGDLYSTMGPFFGAVPYDVGLFTFTKVGTMSFTPTSIVTGTLNYDVNGVAVTKSLVRETLVNETYAGHFGGSIREVDTCQNPALNGTFENLGIVNISQSGTAVTIAVSPLDGSPLTGPPCQYSGTLTQFGQMGDVVGTYTCGDGGAGTFEVFEFQVTEFSVTGRFSATYTDGTKAGCQGTGYFVGMAATAL
jgi:hypothetical protein